MKMRSQSRNSLKTKNSVYKYILVGVTLSMVIGFACYLVLNFGKSDEAKAASAKQSRLEKKGDWENPASWILNSTPSSSDNYLIDGTITRNGDISLGNGQSLMINSGDTLVITGDLILDNKSVMTIGDSAAVIVRGNYETHQQTNDLVSGGGVLVVVGKISFLGGAANITAYPGSNIYYDQTLNGDLSSRISGGGTLNDISSVPPSMFNYTYGTPMPVNIANLAASIANQSVLIKWNATGEENINFFEIQKSSDAVNFDKVGQIQATNSDAYSFTDYDLTPGHWYYRLAILGTDNSIDYSTIAEVDYASQAKSGITLYPSICKGDEINFKGEDIQNKAVKVMVYDLNGKTVLTDKISMNQSDTYTLNFNKKLDRGNYYVHFMYDNHIEKQKFIVSY